MKRRLLSLLTAATLAAALATSARAQTSVPALINYQAYVTDDAGLPYGNTLAGTNFDVTFKIYNSAATPAVVWAEKQTVTIAQGRFSVLLGNGVAIDGSTPRPALNSLFGGAPPAAAVNQNLSIGITVNTPGGTTATEFAPRQQLVANPLALRAASAATADSVVGSSINSAAILDGAIASADLAALAVSTGNIADNAVTNAKLADNAVGNAELADAAVGTAELQNGSVTNAKLADNAVGNAKLADDAVGAAEIVNNTVGTAELAGDAVTPGKLASDVNSLTKVSGGRIATTSATAPLTITTGNISTANDWDILLNDSGGGRAGIRIITGSADNAFLDMTNAAAPPNVTSGTGFARLNNAGVWTTVSDRRLKRDITPLTGLLDKALALQPMTYHFKSEADTSALHMGFVAQDVQAVVPSLVTPGDTLTMDYAGMSTVAIGAIKEQHAIVEGQGTRIGILEKENADLKARLERLENALSAVK